MLNYVMMLGRLTADPEMRTTESGAEFTAFSVAVQRPKSKDKETETDFFDCIAWDKRARVICDWYSKGSLIMIVGALRNRRYTDKNGNNRVANQIVVREVHFTSGNQKKNDDELPPTPDELKDFTVISDADIPDLDEDETPF